jgi:hypothetical protein
MSGTRAVSRTNAPTKVAEDPKRTSSNTLADEVVTLLDELLEKEKKDQKAAAATKTPVDPKDALKTSNITVTTGAFRI